MIVCCGEALIDFMPVKTSEGADAFQPFNGGSIYNVAIGLGRLGTRASFLGGLSKDMFGTMLSRELKNSHVDTSLVIESAHPSTLAFVRFVDGQPEYTFIDEGSAGRMISSDQLPVLDNADLLHFGSISLIHDPAASFYEALAKREKNRCLISLDPNIRPSLIADRQAHVARLGRMIAVADIIKVSDEDLDWLSPGESPKDWAGARLDNGAFLVVVTSGQNGSVAYGQDFELTCPVEKVGVVDTVGAGDAFMAGLLASLDNQNVLTRDNLADGGKMAAETAIRQASHIAALTVSRAGANPPRADEILGLFD